jgi:hypothetical protein
VLAFEKLGRDGSRRSFVNIGLLGGHGSLTGQLVVMASETEIKFVF